MMRRALLFAFVCGLSMGAWSCQQAGSPSSPAPVSALSRFEPYLNAQLTPAIARARFGQPDEETGSGLRIYIYKLSDGRRLWLGFPGDAPITYARIEDANGTFTDLPLR
jgi:hypothetical protein